MEEGGGEEEEGYLQEERGSEKPPGGGEGYMRYTQGDVERARAKQRERATGRRGREGRVEGGERLAELGTLCGRIPRTLALVGVELADGSRIGCVSRRPDDRPP